MSLKDTWVDKVNEVDDIDAEDINSVARTAIELEETMPTKPGLKTGGGEIFNDYEKNIAQAEKSVASGYQSTILDDVLISDEKISYVSYVDNILTLSTVNNFFDDVDLWGFRIENTNVKIQSDVLKVLSKTKKADNMWSFEIEKPIEALNLSTPKNIWIVAILNSLDGYTGAFSYVEGWGNIIIGRASHAENWNNKGFANYVHLEGTHNIGSAAGVHIEGGNNEGNGSFTHLEGCNNISEKGSDYSHLEGIGNKAKASNTHLEGYHLIALHPNAHYQGKFNDIEDTTPYADVVGGGTSESDRKNIRTLDWDGNGWYAGILTLGKDRIPVATKTDLEKYSNAMKIRVVDESIRLDGISPLTHSIAVKAVGDITNNTKITELGKNILGFKNSFKTTSGGITLEYDNETQEFTLNGTGRTNYLLFGNYVAIQPKLGKEQKVTLTVKKISGQVSQIFSNNMVVLTGSNVGSTEGNNAMVCKLPDDTQSSSVYLDWDKISGGYLFLPNTVTFTNYKFRLQLELGDKPTELTLYRPAVVHSLDDSGQLYINSTQESTLTFISNQVGLSLEAVFNEDINTTIDNIRKNAVQISQVLTCIPGTFEWNELWDKIQGTLPSSGLVPHRSYTHYYFKDFDDLSFKPKIPFRINNATTMFARSKITNLAKALERQKCIINGVEKSLYIDYSVVYAHLDRTFAYSTITHIPAIVGSPSDGYGYNDFNFDYIETFKNCFDLETIDLLGVTFDRKYTGAFDGCAKLKNIAFDTTFGYINTDISFADSPLLTRESIDNVFNALGTQENFGKTVTFNKVAINNAFDIDVDNPSYNSENYESYQNYINKFITDGGWTITYR